MNQPSLPLPRNGPLRLDPARRALLNQKVNDISLIIGTPFSFSELLDALIDSMDTIATLTLAQQLQFNRLDAQSLKKTTRASRQSSGGPHGRRS